MSSTPAVNSLPTKTLRCVIAKLPRRALPIASLCTDITIVLLKEKSLLAKGRLQIIKPGSPRIELCEEQSLCPGWIPRLEEFQCENTFASDFFNANYANFAWRS